MNPIFDVMKSYMDSKFAVPLQKQFDSIYQQLTELLESQTMKSSRVEYIPKTPTAKRQTRKSISTNKRRRTSRVRVTVQEPPRRMTRQAAKRLNDNKGFVVIDVTDNSATLSSRESSLNSSKSSSILAPIADQTPKCSPAETPPTIRKMKTTSDSEVKSASLLDDAPRTEREIGKSVLTADHIITASSESVSFSTNHLTLSDSVRKSLHKAIHDKCSVSLTPMSIANKKIAKVKNRKDKKKTYQTRLKAVSSNFVVTDSPDLSTLICDEPGDLRLSKELSSALEVLTDQSTTVSSSLDDPGVLAINSSTTLTSSADVTSTTVALITKTNSTAPSTSASVDMAAATVPSYVATVSSSTSNVTLTSSVHPNPVKLFSKVVEEASVLESRESADDQIASADAIPRTPNSNYINQDCPSTITCPVQDEATCDANNSNSPRRKSLDAIPSHDLVTELPNQSTSTTDAKEFGVLPLANSIQNTCNDDKNAAVPNGTTSSTLECPKRNLRRSTSKLPIERREDSESDVADEVSDKENRSSSKDATIVEQMARTRSKQRTLTLVTRKSDDCPETGSGREENGGLDGSPDMEDGPTETAPAFRTRSKQRNFEMPISTSAVNVGKNDEITSLIHHQSNGRKRNSPFRSKQDSKRLKTAVREGTMILHNQLAKFDSDGELLEISEIVYDAVTPVYSRQRTLTSSSASSSSSVKRSRLLSASGNRMHLSSTRSTTHKTPIVTPIKAREEEQRKKILAKQNLAQERLLKYREDLREKADSRKRKKEERMQQAKIRREANEKAKNETLSVAKQTNERAVQESRRLELIRQERERHQQRILKIEEHRKQEEADRQQKIKDKELLEERNKIYLQKKRAEEDCKKKKRLEEHKRKMDLISEKEQKKHELMIQRQAEEAEEEKIRLQKKQREREVMAQLKKAERERMELEKQLQKEKKRAAEELEQKKELERLRLNHEELARQEQRAKEERIKALLTKSNLNSASKPHPAISRIQGTLCIPPSISTPASNSMRPPNPDSYEITPISKPVKVLPDPENYDISGIRSDDDSDDEDNPAKPIPDWAKGRVFKTWCVNQMSKNIKTTDVFGEIGNPDLRKIFSVHRARFVKRTSSAIWDIPPSLNTSSRSFLDNSIHV